ncbi:uncharacterized protein LOC142164772 [Nicotiana tabacum]|uniref:Uncharacterized protein LOC142164772 n=1 Tax=Nicotiana tabacum TaxID=4097 RepID=A0AC58S394_TOBAC
MHNYLLELIVFLILYLLLLQVKIVGGFQENYNVTNGSSNSSSLWLKSVVVKNPRAIGCWNRPWICNEGEFPPRIKRLCCRNRCVEVTSDVNNCGLCGIRCPFTWQCCRGLCINTNMNPFHCGSCEHRCQFPSLCFNGMCGYAEPLPPFPFPPRPPKPPRPPHPFPPKPPFPFPPKPPRPPSPFPPKPPRPPFPFPPKPPRPPFPFPPKPPRPPFPHPPWPRTPARPPYSPPSPYNQNSTSI